MTRPPTGIAIIGVACIFPGARDVRQYWHNILHKVDAVGDAPPDWESDLFFDAEPGPNDRTYCKRGGFLGPLSEFDAAEYGVMPGAVDGTEPDHFLALKTASEALADAGYRQRNPYSERTAVVIGRGTYVNRGNTTAIQHSLAVDSVLRVLKQLHPEHSGEELAEIKRRLKESLPPFHADTAAGLVPNIISGRIANRLDLMGPNYIVDAACASSLVAVDLAIQDLVSGRCDMAVAGGVHASTTPVILIIFSHLKALSKKGEIRPFSADADGTLLGEGVGMVVLKRLADAERDGDRIYAVIRGVGVASDGRALGLLAPRREGEELALRRAYEAAGVDPSTVELVEAHGTGTLVGDAVELEALNSVFGLAQGEPPRCALGSVKSMISHTMPAAGAAGLIKAALALHHKVLPPTLHCENPNPKLELDKSRFYLNRETRPWIHGSGHYPRRAGVNAFGFGGINAHTVLEEYTGPNAAPALQDEWDAELFVLSAADAAGLKNRAEELRGALRTAGEFPLRNLAWTLNCGGTFGPARLAIVASSAADLSAKLENAAGKLAKSPARIRDKEGIFYFQRPLAPEHKLAVVFPGEGAQYTNMLLDLCVHFPEVREWFDLMDSAFEKHARGFRPSETVFPIPSAPGGANRLFHMDAGAEAVFTGNQALWALLEKFDLRPDAFVGHSTGEHSALLASGTVRTDTREELIRHILGVNRAFEELSASGKISGGILLAVAGADHGKLEAMVRSRGDLYFALDNCPHQVVLCGSEESAGWVETQLSGSAAICQKLPIGRAYHTPLFQGFAEELKKHFDTLTVQSPKTDLFSCVTASRYPRDPEQIRELASRQWASTVRFRETVSAMYEEGFRIFVECGPRGNLTSFIEDTLGKKPYAAIAANVQHRSGIVQLQHLLGMLVAHGVDLNLAHLYARRSVRPFPEQTSARKGRPMHIHTGLQPLRLMSTDGLRQPAAVAAAAAGTIPAAQPAPVSQSAIPAPHAAVLQKHLATMQQFLASQQQVMQAYLQTRGGVRTPAAPAALPFITEVVQRTADRVVVRHHISLGRDKLFLHHTLGRQVSDADPTLTGLPIVPLTVTMEMLAEAASLLMPSKVLSGMREVRSSRWITLDRDLTVEMTAALEPEPGAVSVRLRAAEAGDRSPVWAEGVMLFADAYPSAGQPSPVRWQNGHASAWRDERLYLDGMFHGPSFMAVRHMKTAAENGTVALLEVLPRTGLFADQAQPRFLTDPIILDAAGQVVAFWSQEKLLPYCDIFPFRLVALHCYQPPQAPGTPLECRVFARRVTEREIESDIEIVDAAGRLHYRLEGWMDRRFLLPRKLWDLRIQSGQGAIGESWSQALPAGSDEVVCSLVQDFPNELLEGSHGIWADMLAHLILSRSERAEWESLRASAAPKRILDWLRGRCAAKHAVRLLVKQRTGAELRAADIELTPDQWGRPCVQGAWRERLDLFPVVSLSHSGELAVALAAASASALVGIDLESVARAGEGFEQLVFHHAERGLVQKVLPERQREWSLRLWCAKEAVAKALGRGFQAGFQALEVTQLDESGTVYVELRDGLADAFPEFRQRRFRAHTSADKGFVISTVVSSKDPEEWKEHG